MLCKGKVIIMIINIGIEDNKLMMEDNVTGQKLYDAGSKELHTAINTLDFAYGLKAWARKYERILLFG